MDDHIIRRVSATYDDAERFVLRMIREAVQQGLLDDAAHYRAQHAAFEIMQRTMWRYLVKVEQGVYDDVLATLREATHYGHMEAARSIPGTVHVPSVGIEAIALETTTAVTSQRRQILRAAADIYRKIARQTIAGGLVAGAPVETVAQRMLSDLAARGVQTFTDSAGREWGMEAYTRMVARTGAQRAMNEGRRQTFIENGVKLVRASQHRTSHPWCAPYQGRILSLTGESGDVQVQDRVTGEIVVVNVAATLDEAEANGYHHPNAILGGSQLIDTLGGTTAGSKGTYRGPAVTIRTSESNWITVSPNHPVLTRRGWVTAQSVCEGDQLACAMQGGAGSVDVIGTSHFDNVMPTVEDEFSALENSFPVASAPAAGHNFNDDRKFLEGEVNIVVSDDRLLHVPNPEVIEETGQVVFNGASAVKSQAVGNSSPGLNLDSVGSPVAGTLPYSNPIGVEVTADSGVGHPEDGGEFLGGHSRLVHLNHSGNIKLISSGEGDSCPVEPVTYRRFGDSQSPSDVALCFPGGIEFEDVVSVEVSDFHGPAYDFQTWSGVYSLNSIVVHNCRHTDHAYIPGMPTPDPIEYDPQEYEDLQRQRQLERHLRRWRREKEVALTAARRRQATEKVRVWQAELKRHVDSREYLSRYYERER